MICRITAAVALLLLQLLAMSLEARPRESAQKIPQLRKTLQECREKKDLPGESLALLRLGVAEADLGNVDNARSNLTDAAKMMSVQNDVVGTWMAHFALAHVENAMGRPEEAIVLIEKALAMIAEAGRSGASFSLRPLLAASGLTPEAIDSFEAESKLLAASVLHEHIEPITRDLYGSLLTQTGQLERAEKELNEARRASQGKYDFSIAAHFGDLRFRQERHDEARAHYREAVNGFAAGSPVLLLDRQTVLAGIYDRLAQLELVTGHPERARHWNDQSLAIALSLGGPGATHDEVLPVTHAGLRDALKVAAAMKNVRRQAAIEARLGNLQIVHRKYGSAAAHFERSLQLYGSLSDPPPTETSTWGDLCLVYIKTGNYAAAESVLAHAHQRVGNRSDLGDDMLAFIETTLRLYRGQATVDDLKASVERYIRHVPAAEIEAAGDVQRLVESAAMVFKTNDFSLIEAPSGDTMFGTTMRLAEGAQQFQQGNFESARTIWLDALEKNPGDADRAGLLLMIGMSYYSEGNLTQASSWFAEGTTILEAGIDDLRSEDMLMQYLEDHQGYYVALIESLVSVGKIEQGFEAAERARARAFLRLLGNRRLRPPPGSGIAVVQHAEELRRKIDNWDIDPDPDTSLADLRQQYQALLPRVQVVAGEYESLTNIRAQPIDAVKNALPEDTTLLSYFVTPFSAHAWILDKETLEHVRLRVNESELNRISCWAFQLADRRSALPVDDSGCGADPANAADAYAALIAPLRNKIRKKRLMIVPHGELHYVPFPALYDHERGRYLIQDYPITSVPSASTIRFLREKESPVGGAALVLGPPGDGASSRRQPRSAGGRLEASYDGEARRGGKGGRALSVERQGRPSAYRCPRDLRRD